MWIAQFLARHYCNPGDKMRKMNGPGGATNATPGPTIGDLSEEIANHG